MKIATWNLWAKNNRQREAIDFIIGLGVDFMCFQELKEETVEYIKNRKDVFFTRGIDFYYDKTPYFIGIVSREEPPDSCVVEYKTKLKPTTSFDYFPNLSLHLFGTLPRDFKNYLQRVCK